MLLRACSLEALPPAPLLSQALQVWAEKDMAFSASITSETQAALPPSCLQPGSSAAVPSSEGLAAAGTGPAAADGSALMDFKPVASPSSYTAPVRRLYLVASLDSAQLQEVWDDAVKV